MRRTTSVERSAKRGAGEAARFGCVGKPLNPVARDGGVGGDHGVDAECDERVDAAQDFVVFQVRSELDGDGHVFAAPRVLELLTAGRDPGDEIVELAGVLKLAKVLRVGRRNVDGNVVGVIVDLVEALLIVGERVLDGRDGVLSDVDAENAAAQTEGVAAAEVLLRLCRSLRC